MKQLSERISRFLALALCLCLLAPASVSAATVSQEEVYVRPLAGGVAQIAMSEDHLAVLRSDGTVTAVGNNDRKQCDVSTWTRVVKIWVCRGATVGLTQEGTVLFTGAPLTGWNNIVDVAVYRCDTPDIVVLLGLRANGTVVRAATTTYGMYPFAPGACEVDNWKNIVQIAACDGLYGLTEDGTVLEAQPLLDITRLSPTAHWKNVTQLVGCNAGIFGVTDEGGVYTVTPGDACETWTGVSRVVAGSDGALFGITKDGTIRTGGTATFSVLGVSDWQDVAGTPSAGIGLRYDGTVAFWPEPKNLTWAQLQRWSDVEDLIYYPGSDQVAALRYDGTVVAASITDPGKAAPCDGWTGVARLYCCGQRWLGLKEDGSLIANFKSGDLNALTAGVKNTRPQEQPRGLMAAGAYHSVYLRGDGRVSGAGMSQNNRLAVEGWRDIVAVSAYDHTVGLHSDGTVIAVGRNSHGQCNVQSWKNIADISAGGVNTIGLTNQGTVVVAGSNDYGQHDLAGKKNVVMVEAGGSTVYALGANGNVMAAGSNARGQANVIGWTDVVAISAGTAHVVALRSDGTVVAAGDNQYGQCNVQGWKDIVAISAGGTHTVGLKANGSMVFAGSNQYGQGDLLGWKNVIAISTGMYHTLGITGTGTILSTGSNEYGQCDVGH